jgi:hypothetical protein
MPTAYTWTLTPDSHTPPHGVRAEGRREDGAMIVRYYPDRWAAEQAIADDATRAEHERVEALARRHAGAVFGPHDHGRI